jgi:hypothetical protein
MEGGSPSRIWERWTLPLYYAQLRYWGDHPRLDQIAAAYFRLPRRKTPPPRKNGADRTRVDMSALDAPLTDAERGIGGQMLRPDGLAQLAKRA